MLFNHRLNLLLHLPAVKIDSLHLLHALKLNFLPHLHV